MLKNNRSLEVSPSRFGRAASAEPEEEGRPRETAGEGGLESKNPWMEGIGPRLNAIIHRPDTFLAPTQQASLSAFPRQRSPRHSQAVAPQILQNTDINRLITRLALGVDIYAWKKGWRAGRGRGWGEERKGNRDRSGVEEEEVEIWRNANSKPFRRRV